jgi:hypothetical protein
MDVTFETKHGNKGGTAGSTSLLIAYGQENAIILKNCNN